MDYKDNTLQRTLMLVAVVSIVIAAVLLMQRKENIRQRAGMRCIETKKYCPKAPRMMPVNKCNMKKRLRDSPVVKRTTHHPMNRPGARPRRPPVKVNNKGVLVMFFAPWCGHCNAMKGTWDELVKNFDGYKGTKIIKVNGDENKELCKRHNVMGFPTIKWCPNGLEDSNGLVYQGNRSMQDLIKFIQNNI